MRPVVLAVGVLAWPWSAFAVPTSRPEVLGSVPHDVAAFTQGLLLHDGALYESTGLEGRSSVRKLNPANGDVLASTSLPSTEFGEGLARVEDRLIQLTWKNGVAHVYDLALSELTHFNYEGEGWGLCFDGQRLVMSDGSSSLFFRDPATFELLGSVVVKADGIAVEKLNELECVGSLVYANVWQTDSIVRIDPANGEVLTLIDAASLLTAAEDRAADVLNGIAFDSSTGHFLITGKLWPHVFEVRFDFDAGSRDAGAASSTPPASGTSASDTPPSGTPPRQPSAPTPSMTNSTPATPTPPQNAARDPGGCALASAGGTGTLGVWAALALSTLWVLRRRRSLPFWALLPIACSSSQRITQTGPNSYRIDCRVALSRCLEQVEYVCPHGFDLRDAVEERERRGIDAVGTGVDVERHSEAIVVCRSSVPLIDLGPSETPKLPETEERLCTPGGTQQCIGGGGCRGGQSCLPSGTGYGPCDCVLGAPVPAASDTNSASTEPAPTGAATTPAAVSGAPTTGAAPAAPVPSSGP